MAMKNCNHSGLEYRHGKADQRYQNLYLSLFFCLQNSLAREMVQRVKAHLLPTVKSELKPFNP